jgi:hypothetical protein
VQDRFGAEREAFHDARPKSLEQDVSVLEEHQCGFAAVGRFEIGRHDAASALDDVAFVERWRTGTHDTDHVRAHVREQHRCERHGADAGEFDYPEAA